MKMRWLLGMVLAAGLLGCAGSGSAGDGRSAITVFAASSLTDAFSALGQAFEAQHPGSAVVFNFAGSSQLAAQLVEGAEADVFAPANATQMQKVIDAGRVAAGTERWFVSNRLTVIVPADNPAGIGTLEDLARPGVALLLAVEGVPVRQYTDAVVAAVAAAQPAGFQEAFYANVVSEEENVRQVAAKVALGEADAGIVYTSDVTPDMAGQVRQIAIPDAQNVVAAYPIAALADSANSEPAQRFIAFVLSAEGQVILAQWGFGPPPGE